MQIPKHYKKYCLAKKNSNSTGISVLQYPAYTKKDIFKKKIEENKKDSKKVWEAINAIIINNTNAQKSPQIILYKNNVITTDDKALANHFYKCFTSIADKLIKKIPQTNHAYYDYPKNPNKKSLLMHPANPEEIEKVIKSLKVGKAVQQNSISPVILRNSLSHFVS